MKGLHFFLGLKRNTHSNLKSAPKYYFKNCDKAQSCTLLSEPSTMEGPQKEQDVHESEEVLHPDLSETADARCAHRHEDLKHSVYRVPLHG